MDKEEFKSFRNRLNKTQKEMAQLLGTSIKAVHSYEQGWRTIPAAVERQVYYLVVQRNAAKTESQNCWNLKNCPHARKNACPAWEFQTGNMCWFVNGVICKGEVRQNWSEKMAICRTCEVMANLLG